MTWSPNPRISLVTPNYNGEAFLDLTLRSVLSQNYDNLDYVLVDGASTDCSADIMRRYRDQVSDIIIEADDGHADALNKGFARTDGEIMGWINSDDVLLPGCLEIVGQIFNRFPDVQWITGLPSTCDETGNLTYVGPLKPWSQARFLSGDHLWIQQESTFWRRSLWEQAGALDTQWKVANDFDLWARFFRHAPLHSVDTLLGCFRVRDGQRSVDHKALYMQEVDQILTRELRELPLERRERYGSLLPNAPRHLSAQERAPLEPRLITLDPPPITPDQLRDHSATVFHPVTTQPIPTDLGATPMGGLAETAKRNVPFLAGLGLIALLGLIGAALVPEARVWIALVYGLGMAISLSIAVAIKTRRILKSMVKAIEDIQQSHARTAYQRHMTDLELMGLSHKPISKDPFTD